MTQDLTTHSVIEMRRRLQNGDITARALTESYLARIEALDADLNAFLITTPEHAINAAEAADVRIQQGDSAPLLGIPVAIKDVLSTSGIRTTCGSRILENYVPPFNATVVQRLLDSGAIILGKTNTDEFAMGSSTENSGYFVTHNPWDSKRVPGGSSGGSAAAVSARLAPLALGTDTGGSVRQPGSFCGVVAVKPSYGRVSRFGLIAFASSLDVVGMFARHIEDAALVLSVIAGHDVHDSTSLTADVPNYQEKLSSDIAGLKIGIPYEYFVEGLATEVEQAVRAAIRQLEALGAEVHSISLPHTEYALAAYYLIAPAEASANLARFDGVRYGVRQDQDTLWDTYKATRGEGFGTEVKRRIMLGTYALSAGYYDAYYGKAQQVRTLIKQDFERAFENVDIVCTPTAPTTAFPIGERIDDPLQMYLADIFTLPASLAGIGALNLPCGFDSNGLPIGLQMIAPFLQEQTLFNAAYAYQSATDWHHKLPPL